MNMDQKTWEQWADRIDEAKKREAYGDLSNIAYQILNSFTITKTVSLTHKEEKRNDGMVVCDHSSDKCPNLCNHKHPHEAIWGEYDDERHMHCTDDAAECGFRIDGPMCVCEGE